MLPVNKFHGELESRKSKVRSFEILHYVSYQATPIDVLLHVCTALSIASARVIFHLLKLSLYSSPAFLFNSSTASPPHQQFQTCFLVHSITSLFLIRPPPLRISATKSHRTPSTSPASSSIIHRPYAFIYSFTAQNQRIYHSQMDQSIGSSERTAQSSLASHSQHTFNQAESSGSPLANGQNKAHSTKTSSSSNPFPNPPPSSLAFPPQKSSLKRKRQSLEHASLPPPAYHKAGKASTPPPSPPPAQRLHVRFAEVDETNGGRVSAVKRLRRPSPPPPGPSEAESEDVKMMDCDEEAEGGR